MDARRDIIILLVNNLAAFLTRAMRARRTDEQFLDLLNTLRLNRYSAAKRLRILKWDLPDLIDTIEACWNDGLRDAFKRLDRNKQIKDPKKFSIAFHC